ncbi:MAG: cytochrome b [Proteobacteria bacterium]|nr:cytochrome b [Pseudomonadota bacterium]
MRDRYTNVAIALHWILALGILAQIGLGYFLDNVPRGSPERSAWVNFHKSIGITLAALIILRLAWRLTHMPPPLPVAMPAWELVAARANHALLYVCMVGMPLTGYVATNFSKFGIKYFGLVTLPPWGIDDKQIYAAFNGAHKILALVFVALILLHVAAALKHALWERDGLLRRMWP